MQASRKSTVRFKERSELLDFLLEVSAATAHDVALMRQIVGPEMGVKASGGIRTLSDFRTMTAAGASRIGASASVKIVKAAAA